MRKEPEKEGREQKMREGERSRREEHERLQIDGERRELHKDQSISGSQAPKYSSGVSGSGV